MSKAIGLKMFPLLFCLLIGTLNLESTILRTVEAGIGYCPTRLIVTDTIQVYGKTEDDVRISGGTEAERNELPWQAFIRVTFWSNTTAVCGGTYIGNTWVLSAAHCFYGAKNVMLYLGAYNVVNGTEDGNVQAFQIALSSINTHPDWFFGELENNIALIKLPTNPTLNGYVTPARLPFSDDRSLVGEEVTLSGWGNYSATDGSTSAVLRKATSAVISSIEIDDECQRLTQQLFMGEKIICADGTQGVHYCYGDDGGPMSHFRPEEGGDWFVVGVAGLGQRTSDCLTSQLPNLYARVQYYLTWIYDNTDLVPEVHKTTKSVEITTETSTTTSSTFTCSGQADGYYADPLNPCSATYYQCLNGKQTEYNCSIGMVFNINICACDVPVNVLACHE